LNVDLLLAIATSCVGTPIALWAFARERAARRAANKRERHYRLLAEAVPHIVYTTDASGAGTYANRAWYDYTGLDELPHRGDAWLVAIHPDDRPTHQAAWSRAIASGEPFEIQARIRRAADGIYRWFVTRATPMSDDVAGVVAWIGSAVDIHDVKLATETRSILDTMGHITKIVARDGQLTYVSPNWWTYTGMPPQAGARAADWRRFVHPEDIGLFDLIHAADVPPGTVQNHEIRLRARDGTYRWFLRRSAALPQTQAGTPHHITTLTDIDDLRRAQVALAQSEMRYRELADAVAQMIWIVDEGRTMQYVNARWTSYTGLTATIGAPSPMRDLVHPDDRDVWLAANAELERTASHQWQMRLRRADGAYRWHLLCTSQLTQGSATERCWIVTATDIEERRAAEIELAESAAQLAYRNEHDALTDLPNRAVLAQRLTTMIQEARHSGRIVVVMYLDIDHFKLVNDTLGHNAGDQLLVETATRIRTSLRGEDIASRFGGDEFVIVCAADDIVDAAGIADRIQAAIRAPLVLLGKRVVVASTMGISLFPHDGDVASDLVTKADSAMHEAKHNGRNAWSFYSEPAQLPVIAALELEVELREAIDRDQFVIYYQPIIDIASGHSIGAEALVRWQHPERGLLAPGEFIPFAEEHGLIAEIGEIVLHAACDHVQRLNLHPAEEFSIAVNVSAHQFARPSFVGSIAAAIDAHGIDARRLEIEITESVVVGNAETVATTLHALQALGVRLSLDDFGTGYSSLAYLKNFPINTLKIDRSFVIDIAENPTDQAIAKTIVTLAHSLGMRTIAEGVETAEQFTRLRALGADCFQGYYASHPLAAADLAAFITASGALALRT
jgi:diguanylate cyclase (GGDEF)-like protein/PAS domain S-box-containing protein